MNSFKLLDIPHMILCIKKQYKSINTSTNIFNMHLYTIHISIIYFL